MSHVVPPADEVVPRGESEVVEAVLAAAGRLFAENDPGSVSMRTIAQAAGVNYGLLHRHFGTKIDLVEATVRRYSDQFVASTEAESDPGRLVAEMAAHYLGDASIARTLAWAAANGADEASLVGGLRDVTALVDAMKTSSPSAREVDLLFAFAASVVLGVTVFGGIGLAAAGAKPDEDRADLEALTIDIVRDLVARLTDSDREN